MGSRKKDVDDLVRAARNNGCDVHDPGKGKRYRIMCACGQHMTYVSKTPSGMYYVNRKRNELRGWTCWRQDRE